MRQKKTLTRRDLGNVIHQTVGLSNAESMHMVKRTFDIIAEALDKEEKVKISSFGSFSVQKKAQRIGRNPKTGEKVPIPPRRVLAFKPSHKLKEKTNKGI